MAKYFYVSSSTSEAPKTVYAVAAIVKVRDLETASEPGSYITLPDSVSFSVKGRLLDVLATLEVDALYIRLEPLEKEFSFGWM